MNIKHFVIVLLMFNTMLFSSQKSEEFEDKIRSMIILSAWAEALGNAAEQHSCYSTRGLERFIKFLEVQNIPLESFKDIKHEISGGFWKGTDHPEGSYPYTDDTRMAWLVGQALLDNKENIKILMSEVMAGKATDSLMSSIANNFITDAEHGYGWSQAFRHPGQGCGDAIITLSSIKDAGNCPANWWNLIGNAMFTSPGSGGGCGSVMRAYPFGIFFTDPKIAACYAAQHSNITHPAPMARAACAAMAYGISKALHSKETDLAEIVTKMITSANMVDDGTALKMQSAWDMGKNIREKLNRKSLTAENLFNAIFNHHFDLHNFEILQLHQKFFLENWGGPADTAIAAVVYLLALSVDADPSDLPYIIRLGVAHPGDSDSIGCMIGAFMGAFYGTKALDNPIINDVEKLEGFIPKHKELAVFIKHINNYFHNGDAYTYDENKFVEQSKKTSYYKTEKILSSPKNTSYISPSRIFYLGLAALGCILIYKCLAHKYAL